MLPQFCPLRFVLMIVLLLASYAGISVDQHDLPPYSKAYDASRDPYADTKAALMLARETDRKLLIEVGGDWCSWCYVLDRFLADHDNVAYRLHETFVVLKVNVSDANDNARFMATLPPARGYPHMYITDSSGVVLHSQNTGQFIENSDYSEQQFIAFLDYWQSQND